jgi:uncharacterized protein YhbP (UPF0306 family)
MSNTDEPLFESGESFKTPSPLDGSALEARIRRLVEGQSYAVLCTQSQSQPYGALVAFAFSEDLKQAVFATPMATRKFRILCECNHVALLIDDRPDHTDDFMKVEAITVTGRAVLLEDERESSRWARLLVTRHPYLRSFVLAPSCALFRIDVVRFFDVIRFQEVSQWTP